jgi:uncharacterized protein YggE
MIGSALALLAASAIALPATSLAAAESACKAEGPVIELSIYESISLAPDIATIGAGVTTEAPSATEALRQNSREMQRVVDRLKALGVAARDIQTSGINLSARYDYDQSGRKPVFRSYQASNRVSVTLRKLDRVGEVLDALVAAGANDLFGPSFAVENDEAAKEAARQRAIARAQARAKSYAEQFGYGGARILWLNESIESRGPMPEVAMMKANADRPAAAPPVEPGMVSTGIVISFKFELVPKETPPTW